MKNKVIFIDRDGALNEEVGYITDLSQFRLYDYSAEAVRLINQSGRKAIVITNQAGVARGYFTEVFLNALHDRMKADLAEHGAWIDGVYYCPHHPTEGIAPYRVECVCRKPKTAFIEWATRDFNLDLTDCFTIGDRYSDVQLAHSVGGRGVLVLTGHGANEYETGRDRWLRPPDHVAKNLLEAVKWALSVS
jgi:D,D-heptose 1,7-bisphosphate phosphatase